MPENKPQKSPLENYSTVSLGLNMAVGVGFFSYAGYMIDQKTGSQIWTPVGFFFGLLYCSYEIWKLIRKINQ